MVIILGNGIVDKSSNPRRGMFAFYFALMPLVKTWVNSRTDLVL